MAQIKNINMTPDSIPPVVKLSQYDVGRTLTFKLVDGSAEYTVPAGATVKLEGTKPSSLGFTEACTIGTPRTSVTVDTTAVMTDEFGIINAELVVREGTDRIGSSNIRLDIERSPHPTGTYDGSVEELIPVITVLVNRAEAAATDAEADALKAEGFAVGQQNGDDVSSESDYFHNNAKYYKEQAASSANNANHYSEQAGESASTASTNGLKAEGYAVGKQNGTDVESGSEYYHNNAKYYKEAAEEAAETAEALVGDLATEATQLQIEEETDDIVDLLAQIASGSGIMRLKAIGEKQSGEDVEDALDRLDGNPSNADVVIVDEVAYIYDSTNATWLTLGGGAGSLNGFSFSLGTGDELKITYTDPEDETDTVTITAPTNTTMSAIASALADLANTWKGVIITNG